MDFQNWLWGRLHGRIAQVSELTRCAELTGNINYNAFLKPFEL